MASTNGAVARKVVRPVMSSATASPGPRVIVRIELTPTAKKQSVAVAERFGMTQIATASRLIEWFAMQPEDVQTAILGLYPKEAGVDVARTILERMAGE